MHQYCHECVQLAYSSCRPTEIWNLQLEAKRNKRHKGSLFSKYALSKWILTLGRMGFPKTRFCSMRNNDGLDITYL